jgi:hypothetical protein
MTLKIYVTQDTNGKEWLPDKPQEVEACEWMLKKAWMEFQHLQELYAVIVNLRKPSADMVVVREIGLGVLELKHHPGEIIINQDGVWMAGKLGIHSGQRLNPREQVRYYAKELRENTIRELLPAPMQTNRQHWDDLKFQTAVCFTNPLAKLHTLKGQLGQRPTFLEKWEESFSVFDIDFFTTWVRKLRFELAKNPPRDFSPVRQKPEKIIRIMTEVLGAVEWEEMIDAMPVGNPYGCLILEDDDGRQIFNLIKDHSVIGRSHECDVVLPSQYGRVGKQHLIIERSVSGITVTDQSSQNGTFLNGQRVRKPANLVHGNVLALGGPPTGRKACVLTFELQGMQSDETTETELGTRDVKDLATG